MSRMDPTPATPAHENSKCSDISANHQKQSGHSRRLFLTRSALALAAAAVAPTLLMRAGKAEAAVLSPEAVRDALNGVLAFVVPGGDAYSVQQGLTHATPGGVESYAVLPLEYGLNQGAAPPPFESLSELIAYTLNTLTGYVNPAVTGPFASAFANLSFAEKAAVFQIMESGAAGAELVPLANSLLLYAGLMTYSEAPVLNPVTGELMGTPVGWTISSYDGIADGHADYQGYYRGRRAALP